MHRYKLLVMLAALAIMVLGAAGVGAQDDAVTLTMTCRCVEGGVNSNLVVWLKTYVIPTFEERMAEQGVNVTVELVEFGGSDEQLKQQYALDLGVGAGADLMSFDGFWVPEFVDAGLIQPLEAIAGEIVNEWDGWEHIPEAIQELLSYRGERYGIPVGTDVRVIYYREDVFTEAGIEVPWQPTSWADILETAEQLKEAGVEIPIQLNAGTPMGEATTMQGFFMALLGAGHHLYDFDEEKWIVSSPALLETLRFYEEIYVNRELGDARMQLVEDGRQRSFEAFANGEVGMLVEGDFFWRSPMFELMGVEQRNSLVRFALMPAREPGAGYRGQDYVTISGGTGWILNPNTEHPELAWGLLSHMSDVDAVRAFQLIQPRISFRDDVPVAGDPTMTAMADAALSLSTVRPQLPEYPQISVEVQLMTERVVSGEMSPEEALEAYAEAVTELVGEENVIRIPLE
ncbi:MAG: extracellular solute-binding protein [Chloroflexota bacterium]